MPRPVCVLCKVEMQLERAVTVQFNAVAVGGAYEQWCADLAKCPSCGAQVVAQWAREPFWRHHHDELIFDESPGFIVEERPRVASLR